MFGVLLGPRKTEPQAYIYVQTHIKILIQKLKRVISLDMVNGQYSHEVSVVMAAGYIQTFSQMLKVLLHQHRFIFDQRWSTSHIYVLMYETRY